MCTTERKNERKGRERERRQREQIKRDSGGGTRFWRKGTGKPRGARCNHVERDIVGGYAPKYAHEPVIRLSG